nr:MAG TPA: hypothetical protein [Caudoviricetes sp.]
MVESVSGSILSTRLESRSFQPGFLLSFTLSSLLLLPPAACPRIP